MCFQKYEQFSQNFQENYDNFAFQPHFNMSAWTSTKGGALDVNHFDRHEKRLRSHYCSVLWIHFTEFFNFNSKLCLCLYVSVLYHGFIITYYLKSHAENICSYFYSIK